MPTEMELEQRRLDLHERELALREQELHERSRKRSSLASMLPLPLAAAIASGAVTLWQFNQGQTQQNYEREIAAVRYYLDNRDQKFAFDSNGPQSTIEAVRMLKQMSPDGFAVVKCDLWNRAYLQIPPDQYLSYKTALEKVLFGDGKSDSRSESDEALCRDVPVAEQKTHKVLGAGTGPTAKPGAVPAPSPESPGVEANAPYKIFVQVAAGRPRKLNALLGEPAVQDLRSKGFEFASHGVATLSSNVRHAEVRYYGRDQETKAKILLDALRAAFAAEGLEFHLRPIGEIFPDLPKRDIEILVPAATPESVAAAPMPSQP